MKKAVLTLIALTAFLMLFGATVAEVYAGKNVAALCYYDRLSLIDLDKCSEVDVFKMKGLIDYQWDSQGKNLFALVNKYISGPNYDSPERVEVCLYQVLLPAGTSSLLKTIKVPTPEDYAEYAYPMLFLDKAGNPVIVLYYGMEDQDYLQYTFNLATKVLSAPSKKNFDILSNGYQRKNQAKIYTEGRYYSEESINPRTRNSRYNLFSTEGGYGLPLVYTEELASGYSALDEPLRYCISPDSSFIVLSFRWDEEINLGSIYAISTDDYSQRAMLSDMDYMGVGFVPMWINGSEMPFYQPIKNFEPNIIPAIKCVGKDAKIRVIKEWERSSENAPLTMKMRMK